MVFLGLHGFFSNRLAEFIDLCVVNARIKGFPPGNRASPWIIGYARVNRSDVSIKPAEAIDHGLHGLHGENDASVTIADFSTDPCYP